MESEQEMKSIYLINLENYPIQVASISQGRSFSKHTRKQVPITKLQVNAGQNSDEFYFSGSQLVFHYITNKSPLLTNTYARYFKVEPEHSAEGLLKYVLTNYFVQRLGYNYPVQTNVFLG